MIVVVENAGGSRFDILVKKENVEAKKKEFEGWGLKIVEVRSR